jgi:hypothetical protein
MAVLACGAFTLLCLAAVVFAELAAPLFVVSFAFADQIDFFLILRACVEELWKDVVLVGSPLFVLVERVA